jgi:hypothetical protein
MSTEVSDELFQQLQSAGNSLKSGLWSAEDLDTLRTIAADVAALELKAQVALRRQDHAHAAMYRAAANRALDSSANLALVRMQAVAAQLDALRTSFLTQLWNAIAGLLPGLTSPAPSSTTTPESTAPASTTTTAPPKPSSDDKT